MSRRIVNLTSLQLALARNNPSGGIGRSVPRANVGGGFSNEHSTSTISRQGKAGPGASWRGHARQGQATTRRTGGNSATFSWRGRARRGTAGRGWARQVNHERTGREQVQYFHGTARRGTARRGWAGLGMARRTQGRHWKRCRPQCFMLRVKQNPLTSLVYSENLRATLQNLDHRASVECSFVELAHPCQRSFSTPAQTVFFGGRSCHAQRPRK